MKILYIYTQSNHSVERGGNSIHKLVNPRKLPIYLEWRTQSRVYERLVLLSQEIITTAVFAHYFHASVVTRHDFQETNQNTETGGCLSFSATMFMKLVTPQTNLTIWVLIFFDQEKAIEKFFAWEKVMETMMLLRMESKPLWNYAKSLPFFMLVQSKEQDNSTK